MGAQGNSAETSGGLLICLPREQAAAYCKDIQKVEGYQAWIIGIVEKGNRTARIIDKPRVIEVPAKEKEGELWWKSSFVSLLFWNHVSRNVCFSSHFRGPITSFTLFYCNTPRDVT